MAGILKLDRVQVGQSPTAENNLTLIANGDGTFTFARGNADAPGATIATIDAGGNLIAKDPRVLLDVTASRAVGGLYTNDTDVVVKVYINFNSATAGDGLKLSLNGTAVVTTYYDAVASGLGATLDVPPGATYKATGASPTIVKWLEYRLPL